MEAAGQHPSGGGGPGARRALGERDGHLLQAGEHKSGRCLSLAGSGGTADGTQAIIWDCNDGHEQYWVNYSGSGELRNLKSGKCLSLAGGGTADGIKVIIYGCLGSAEQRWDYIG
ncbi:RICIN domain-containing protein [Streptomyces sp. NPDC102462]|uniref:RICIN domain-containing protein n=1 Tax=Streptomyces sp. NPDC102462 TaxID=3366178 RepID=UPI00382D3726